MSTDMENCRAFTRMRAYAVKRAAEFNGVAVTARLANVYESGNRPYAYEISDLKDTTVREGESTLEACMRIDSCYSGKRNRFSGRACGRGI